MSSKSKRMGALMLACIAVVLCVSLMAVGTYALFSETIPVSSHLQAGQLEATLTRVSVTSIDLDEATGKLAEKTNNTPVSDGNIDNVFGLTTTDKIVPESQYTALMRLSNNGDVAFGYYIKVDITAGAGSALAQQLEITVKTADGKTVVVGAGYTSAPLGVVLAGKSVDFTVTAKFVNSDQNNDAENQNVAFDLTVYAEQSLAR